MKPRPLARSYYLQSLDAILINYNGIIQALIKYYSQESAKEFNLYEKVYTVEYIAECPAAQAASPRAGDDDGVVPGVCFGGGEPAGAGALAGAGARVHGGAGATAAGVSHG